MGDRLQPILDAKRAHVAARRAVRPAASLDLNANGPVRGFTAALKAAKAAKHFGLIAEVKKARYIQAKLESDDQAEDIAEALIKKAEMWSKRGSARIIAVLPCGRISQEPSGWQRKPPNSVIQTP